MLLQFSTENFKSFKERAVLSMETLAHGTLKTVAIYGANAAGKSNLFTAMTAAILTVRQSNIRQVYDRLSYIIPFKLSENAKKAPSMFEFVFMAEGSKYVYRFTADNEKIYTEYLYKYNSSRPTTLFEREENKYRFTVPALKKSLLPLIERNTENKLFLATAAAWNSKELEIPYRWFLQIDTFSSLDYSSLLPKVTQLLENDTNGKLKDFVITLLQEADINISDYNVKVKENDVSDILKILPESLLPPILAASAPHKQKSYDIAMVHEIKDNGGQEKKYYMPMMTESKGTQSLFILGPLLKEAFEHGNILCIDEFDTNLHPLLVAYILGLFNNSEYNKNNAQLIISTHATELLNIVEFSDEQIYFVEKDNTTGQSELYSADEFDLKRIKDLHNAYMAGRFGAVPDIDMGNIR